jgi:flagellar biosynthesis protein FlhG
VHGSTPSPHHVARPSASPSQSPSPRSDRPGRVGRVIAVGGGKGGVGKSLVATNLAVALARGGKRVVVLDADLGAPNLHAMFGVQQPPATVEDFLAGRRATLDEIAVATKFPNLRLICGAEGVLGSANPSFDAKQRLLAQLAHLDADCLLVDVGAGVDVDTIDFFNAADIRLCVMVPEITSLQNGYAFLKIALFRRFQRAIAGMRASEKLRAAFGQDAFELGSTLDRVSTFFTLLEDEVPELVPNFKQLLKEFNAQIVGNMLHRPADGNALFAMKRLIRDRLELDADIVASLRQNAGMRTSINAGQPFAAAFASNDPDVFEMTQLAMRVGRQDLQPLYKIREDFLRAAKQRPLDPGVDARFEFGLQGIPTAQPKPSLVGREPRPTPPHVRDASQAAFSSEFRQHQRVSPRIAVQQAIELNVDGHWYVGRLVEVNQGGGLVLGIRAPVEWRDQRGQLRVGDGVGDARVEPMPIVVLQVDHEAGRLIVRFEDPAAAARLVARLSATAAPAPRS